MLMVGAKVLFNSAKMLKMGVLVVFMHDYGHQEALIDIITLVLCQGVPVGPSVAIWGCLWGGVRGCFFNPPYGPYPADLKNRQGTPAIMCFLWPYARPSSMEEETCLT